MKALQIDVLGPFKDIFESIIDSLPTVAGFFGFIIFAWIFVKIFLYVIRKVLAKSNIDKLSEKLSTIKVFGDTAINVNLSKIIVNVLKWFLIMIFVMAGSQMFGVTAVS